MENMKLRCHFSTIFESLWQFWVAIAVILLNQIDEVIDLVREINRSGLKEAIEAGGIWVLLSVVLITLIVLGTQFLRWRKTWIILEDNLVIIERNTLKRSKNTIAIENISAVNMERNLFERMAGTYRIKLDTSSMTTAGKTDVSLVFRTDIAIAFRKTLIDRINMVKGGKAGEALSEERQPDQIFEAGDKDKKVFRASAKDMAGFAFFSMSLWSLAVAVAGMGFSIWFITRYGFSTFIFQALGGFIAVALMVIGAIFDIIGKFIAYYGFSVYRDGRDLHVRRGLIKLRSYTIPIDKITAMRIEQKPFARLFKKYCANVVTVGIGDEQGESSNITMAVSKEELRAVLSELVPEYDWADIDNVMPEKKGSVAVRMFKSVKWHILTLASVLVMILLTDVSPWIAAGVPVLIDGYINLLYFLSHKSAGYMIAEEGMILAEGYFTKKFTICGYDRIQMMTMKFHPAARRRGIGRGAVSLLNLAASVPFVERSTAFEISEKIIGGTK